VSLVCELTKECNPHFHGVVELKDHKHRFKLLMNSVDIIRSLERNRVVSSLITPDGEIISVKILP